MAVAIRMGPIETSIEPSIDRWCIGAIPPEADYDGEYAWPLVGGRPNGVALFDNVEDALRLIELTCTLGPLIVAPPPPGTERRYSRFCFNCGTSHMRGRAHAHWGP